jgi:hypothetical protein
MVCPFVDKADARCAPHLTLGNLARAFAHCADHYTECPVYRELIAHARPYDHPAPAAVPLVAAG